MSLHPFIICFGIITWAAVNAVDPSTITDTLSLANDLGGFIESQDFSKTASKLISSVSPYLGVIGSVLSFAFSFLHTGPSAELLAIQKLYKEVTLRFDRIDHQFATISREIHWVNIETHYGSYESTIHVVGEKYRAMAASTSKTEYNARKEFFINSYKQYDEAGGKIYDGVMGQSNLFNGPIFDEAIRHLEWDRKKTQQFMLGVTKLLIDAAAIEVAYYELTKPHLASFIQHDWRVKFEHLKNTLTTADHKLMTQYGSQLATDVDKFVANHAHSSNCDITNPLQSQLSHKYYWRNWLVVTSDHNTDPKKYVVHVCPGIGGVINNNHGKNVVVASLDAHKSHLSTTQQHVINYVHTTHTYHIMHGGKRDVEKRLTGHRRNDANVAYGSFPNEARTSCHTYGSVGVIDRGLHTCFRSPAAHLYTRDDGHYYKVYAFG
ncbi:uncharacterized protein LOC134230010 [Saccostrea cucullata]|uniref:uncharacterized protein LOC134230010 n=1 Tax=Saccostrea cuccullata TaxID=36930 RepID=UPI002ED2244F